MATNRPLRPNYEALHDLGTPLYGACAAGNHEAVAAMLRHHPRVKVTPPPANQRSLLFAAAVGGHAFVVEELLKHDFIDINARSPVRAPPSFPVVPLLM